MSQSPVGPFSVEKTVKFFEELAGVQFIDAKTKRPVLELVREAAKKARKSDFDLFLEEQDESVRLGNKMEEI